MPQHSASCHHTITPSQQHHTITIRSIGLTLQHQHQLTIPHSLYWVNQTLQFSIPPKWHVHHCDAINLTGKFLFHVPLLHILKWVPREPYNNTIIKMHQLIVIETILPVLNLLQKWSWPWYSNAILCVGLYKSNDTFLPEENFKELCWYSTTRSCHC